jgi:hypothetical protein
LYKQQVRTHAGADAVANLQQFEAFGKRDVAAKQEEASVSASSAAMKAAVQHAAAIMADSNQLPASLISSPSSHT